MPDIDLSPLKDVHLTMEPSFFPPAVGWWIVTGGICLVLMSLLLLIYFLNRSPKRYALRILKKIERQNADLSTLGVELGVLLKRVALAAFPREKVASLSDTEWADFLLQHGNNALSAEQAKFIASAAYLPKQKAVAIQTEKLYTAVREWICCVLKKEHQWKTMRKQ